MRVCAGLACFIVALECAENALGHQTIFGSGYEWLWWPVAVAWLLNALAVWMHGAA